MKSIKNILQIGIFILFFQSNIYAELVIKNFVAVDYKSAKNSPTYLKFEGKSTKLGIVTTDFDGYSKKFSIAYNLNQNVMDQVKIKIESKSFDTNSNSRNEKMNSLCLEPEKFPEIIGTLPNAVDLNIKEQNLVSDFLVLGHNRKMLLKLISEKNSDGYKLKITGNFSLKEWNIPDPSIIVAKVHDQFELTFETYIK